MPPRVEASYEIMMPGTSGFDAMARTAISPFDHASKTANCPWGGVAVPPGLVPAVRLSESTGIQASRSGPPSSELEMLGVCWILGKLAGTARFDPLVTTNIAIEHGHRNSGLTQL